jgi:hypothetical protein
MSNNQLMHSGYERIADDDYKTIDPRCTYAFLQHFKPRVAVDVCAPSGSGIVDVLKECGITAASALDAFSDEYRIYSGSNTVFSRPDWIVSNPPYKPWTRTNEIIYRQIGRLQDGEVDGVAMLMRWGFDFASTRRPMFELNHYYYGQIKLLFRPKWIEKDDMQEGEEEHQPFHPFVFHIWTVKGRQECQHPVVLYSDGRRP